MDIICDTNIWYGFGNQQINTSKISVTDKLIGSYNNIDELSHTTNLLTHPDNTKKAIQAMYNHSIESLILDPPFVHIIKLHSSNYSIDLKDHIEPMVDFTKSIANGLTIDPTKETIFKERNEARRQTLQSAADALNNQAETIKQVIKKTNFKNKSDRLLSIRNLISVYANEQRDGQYLPEDYDWTKVELFENSLLVFFLQMEKGSTKITANDWYDIFLFAYVRPGQKIWTNEKKWLKIIDDADMSHYKHRN